MCIRDSLCECRLLYAVRVTDQMHMGMVRFVVESAVPMERPDRHIEPRGDLRRIGTEQRAPCVRFIVSVSYTHLECPAQHIETIIDMSDKRLFF